MPNSRIRRARLARDALVTALVALALTTPALADTICAPPATGVPGLAPPPQWSGGNAWATIDDPRWRGAARNSFPNLTAGTADATARVVFQGTSVFLSMQTLVDPDEYTGDGSVHYDSVFVGFQHPTSGVAEIVEVSATATDPGDEHATRATRTWSSTNGSTYAAAVGAPTWLTDPEAIKLWVNQVAGATPIPWAVNFKIDLAAVNSALGTSAATPAKFWYAFRVGHQSSPTYGSVSFPWPTSSGGSLLNPAAPTFPAVADWGELFLGATGPNCGGVLIDWNGIGTTNTIPSEISRTADNTFEAKPNLNGETVGAGQMQARFRIANWGSQIGVGGDWADIPGGTGILTTDATGRMAFTCHQGSAPLCPANDPATQTKHQCFLVELSAAGGSSVRFLRDSATRNMDFAPASVFQRSAEINIKGAVAIAGGGPKRDVFLYVNTMNMPAFVKSTDKPRNGRDKEKDRLHERTAYEQATSEFATYEVHVYHDTGKRAPVGGKEALQLQAQNSFGYFMHHAGGLEGWRHRLEGDGVILEELSPNYFKVKVPEGGSVNVKTTIEALEPGTSCKSCCPDIPKPPERGICGCRYVGGRASGVLGVAVALLALGTLLRRRRRLS